MQETPDSPFKSLLEDELPLEKSEETRALALPKDPRGVLGSYLDDVTDLGERKGRLWIRHHTRPRLRFYVPGEHTPGGPELDRLDGLRETRIQLWEKKGASTTTVRFDKWRDLPHYELPSGLA